MSALLFGDVADGEGEALALLVNLEDDDLDHIADGEHLGRVLDIAVTDAGNVDKAVLMDTDVVKDTEIDDIGGPCR